MEHKVWIPQSGHRSQTVYGNNKDSTVNGTALNPKTCLDTEQNVCHFERYANKIWASALMKKDMFS